MHSRLLVIMTAAAAFLTVAASKPEPTGDPSAGRRGRSWWVGAEVSSSAPGSPRTNRVGRSGGGPGCTYVRANAPEGQEGQETKKGTWYLMFCKPVEGLFGINTNVRLVFVPEGQPVPTVTPYELALQTHGQLRPPKPLVRTAPPRGNDGLVGLHHFFWAAKEQWDSISRRAEVGAVWAEVTATPSQLVINPGSGQSRVSCPGPGAPYNPKRSPADQQTDCAVLFTRSSAGLPGSHYQVTVSVVWTARWIGSGGTGGTLAPITTFTTFPLRVAEGQALIQRSS